MSAVFMLRRGRGARRRSAHIARIDVFGNVAGAWCGREGFDLTSNVPWGRPRCKDCLRRIAAVLSGDTPNKAE